jgi:hypothetical protein
VPKIPAVCEKIIRALYSVVKSSHRKTSRKSRKNFPATFFLCEFILKSPRSERGMASAKPHRVRIRRTGENKQRGSSVGGELKDPGGIVQ